MLVLDTSIWKKIVGSSPTITERNARPPYLSPVMLVLDTSI